MLRALVAVLLLANLAFFAWTQGWLDSVVGVRSIGDREPERLQRQVRPESVRILPADDTGESGESGEAVGSASGSVSTLSCFEAGPFTDAEFGAAQTSAQAALPAGSWTTVDIEQPGTWIVYMGRYLSREALTKRIDDLKRRQLPYDEVGEPAALAPGLSLGRFEQRAAAAAALERFTAQGVRTARVVELTPASSRHLLRVEKADAVLSTRLTNLTLAPLNRGFVPCMKSAGT